MTPVEIAVLAGAGLLVLLVIIALVVRSRRVPQLDDDPPEAIEGDTASDIASDIDTDADADTELETELVEPAGPSVFERFRAGLARTRQGLGALFGGDTVDDSLYESLEEGLISADVGVRTAMALVEELRGAGLDTPEALRLEMKSRIRGRLTRLDPALNAAPDAPPHVILVVGVNGSGKTTSIGKLAARFRAEGKSVLLAAGDTFRAGAIEQLEVWAKRSDSEFISKGEGSDPASVCYDALEAAKSRNVDVVLLDTAGRLQSMKPLMEELGKVHRVVGKAVPGAPHEVLLVLDGTMGQNAISQARSFKEVTGVTGVVLTKLDGTAKGGVVVSVTEDLDLPVKFIGIGEGIDDLRPFDAEAFTEALV